MLGRDADLAAFAELVDRRPLVTIVGPGGVGKTALAREVTRRLAPRPTAAAFASSSSRLSTDAAAVPDAVVTALGLTSDGGPPLTALRRAQFMDLVVLPDNCEHVLDAVCEVLGAVLGTESSTLRVVATSRELSGCPTNAPGRCSRWTAPARFAGPAVLPATSGRCSARRGDRGRPGHDIGDRAPPRRTPVGHRTGRRAGRHAGHRRLGEQIEASVAYANAVGPAVPPGWRAAAPDSASSDRMVRTPATRDAKEASAQWTVFAGAVRLSDALAVLQVAPEVIDELARRLVAQR